MPAHDLHFVVDIAILGKKYPEVHSFMDQYQKALQSNHRQYYHDYQTVLGIWNFTKDPLAAEAAYLHIMLDEMSMKLGHAEAVVALIDGIRNGTIKM